MDSRNKKKYHHFSQPLYGLIWVLGGSLPGNEEAIVSQIFADFYREELSLYTLGNIVNCCRLLLRRSLEEV